jgi:hypothetical protein
MMFLFFVRKDLEQRILALPLVSGTVARHYALTEAYRKHTSRTVVMPVSTPFRERFDYVDQYLPLNSMASSLNFHSSAITHCRSLEYNMISAATPKYLHRGNLRA